MQSIFANVTDDGGGGSSSQQRQPPFCCADWKVKEPRIDTDGMEEATILSNTLTLTVDPIVGEPDNRRYTYRQVVRSYYGHYFVFLPHDYLGSRNWRLINLNVYTAVVPAVVSGHAL